MPFFYFSRQYHTVKLFVVVIYAKKLVFHKNCDHKISFCLPVIQFHVVCRDKLTGVV